MVSQVTLINRQNRRAPRGTSDSNIQQTADIPLYVFPDPAGGYKIGINVSLNGGVTYQMYEFDTGGMGFWAAYNPSWWANAPISNSMSASNTYSSTIVYQAQVVSEPITFQGTENGVPTPLTINSGNVAAIEIASKTANPNPFTNAQWQADISATPTPIPPLYGNFFGDFGMSLGTSSNDLFATLPQLTGFSNGFIVNLGSYPTSNTPIGSNNYVQVGTIQVGLTPQDIASFPYLVSMQGMNTGTVFPNTSEPTYQQRLADGTIAVTNGTSSFSAATNFVFDTGAPTTQIHTGTIVNASSLQPFVDDNGNLTSTTTFSLSSPGTTMPVPPGTVTPGWLMSFMAGAVPGQNQVGTTTPDSSKDPGYVNTGLEPFFEGRVMYDLTDGVIGFAPACFAAGTRITTPAGEVSVEVLRVGDTVRTISGGTRPIKWIGHRRVDCRRHNAPRSVLPVRIAAQAFGVAHPCRPLYLSPDHALFLEGVLIPVKYLINGTTIAQVPVDAVTYFHIELDQHDVVLAEGLPAESYLDTGDRASFANGAGHIRLHPQFGPATGQSSLQWEAAGYAPLVVQGAPVTRARRTLRERARLLGLDAGVADITTISATEGALPPALRSHA